MLIGKLILLQFKVTFFYCAILCFLTKNGYRVYVYMVRLVIELTV